MNELGTPRAPWRKLNNLRVGTKIVTAVAVVAIVAVVTAGVAWSRMESLDDHVQRLQNGNISRLDALVTLQDGMADMYRGLFLYQGAQNATDKADYEKQAKQAQQAVDDAGTRYVAVPDAAAMWKTQVKAFGAAWAQYKALVNLLLFGDPAPAGVELPTTLADQYALWGQAETTMNTAVEQLMTLERSRAAEAGAEAHEQAGNAQRLIMVLVGAGVLLALGLALVIGRSVSRRLTGVRTVLDAVAGGDLTHAAQATGTDEVGQMAQAVNRATESIRTTVSALADSSRVLAESSQELSASAEEIAGTAHDTSNQTRLLATASEDVSHSVRTVAAGADEMGSAILEISQSASNAAGVAAQAVTAAATAQHTVAKLGDSSAEIGNVVKVITSIAEQTNLLALNATIEAARAGETGKGFAVVAGEVKELAQETAKATEDISRRVEAIQADTTNAVAAITEISTIISQINDHQMTIASAVEEQTATTAEMTRSITEASQGSSSISDNIASVAAAAQTTTATVSRTQQSAQQLARMSAELRTIVSQFRV
ncbi:chemotaxis protein [Actinoplanes cyaneus]|uniref:Chemotaxis protein n=1 Tax=Actinoplanes cyaneus TaxID=52696 RepID=A0A919IWH2_9ACTN|nr:methyl-accepting chemotaxis protein [Actinoplanes cyaneus]MCW2142335.1 methyl-accepting chemotaxis sensory transducer [Actinoplanes cyaneus]GID69355.1 chemotaxis protein [Actinoplanes cyaneus]